MAPAGAPLPASTGMAAAAAASVASPSAALRPAFLTPPLPPAVAVTDGRPLRQGAATGTHRGVPLGRSAWTSLPPPPSPLLRPCRIRLPGARGAAAPADRRRRTGGAPPPDGGTTGWAVVVASSSSTTAAAAEASAPSPFVPSPSPTPSRDRTSSTSTPLPVDDTDETIADESARLLEWPAVSAAIARWASTPLGLLALSGALEPAAADDVDDGDKEGGAGRRRGEEEEWVEPPPSLAASVAAARARRRRDLSRGTGYSGATADEGGRGGGRGGRDDGGATATAPVAAAPPPLLVRLGSSRADSERLLAETREAYALEFRLACPLVFSGVIDAAPAVAAAARGFILSGKELVGVATTLAAARRLRRQVRGVATDGGREGGGGGADGVGDLIQEVGGAADERPTASQAQFAAAFGGRVAAEAAADRRRKQTEANLGRRPTLVVPPAGSGGSDAGVGSGDVSTSRSVELPTLSALVARLPTFPNFERAITRAVDEQGDVRDSASAELAAVRSDVRAVRSGLRETAAALMARHSDAIQDRVVTSRYGRAVLAVKVAKKGVFRKAVIHDVSATGATVFLEPFEMRGANDRLKTLEAKEQRVEEAVRRSLTERAVAPLAGDGGYAVLEEVVGALDAAAARARYSAAIGGVDVRFSTDAADGGELSLRGVRHPLLVGQAVEEAAAAARRNSRKSGGGGGAADSAAAMGLAKVVPVDYELGGHVRCAVVTGSNTGGKTSTIKTLGVSVMLAKAGVFIHASTSNADDVAILPYFDAVLADIGDDQSLLASLSTFSGHIRRVTRILDATTPASLVLLDELGTGTNPAEGAALGISLLRYLAAGRARLVLATTHHGELTALKYATPEENGAPLSDEEEGEGAEGDTSQRQRWRRRTDDRFENASVEFDDVALRPTYRLIWGIPGRSHALSIAARLGCPSAIIEGARQSLTSAPRPGVIVAGGGGGGGDGDTAEIDGGSGGGATPSGGATTATPQASALIESLEEQRAAAEAAAADAAAARAEAVALRDELAARAATVRAHEAELRAHQEAAFAKEMAAARSAIAEVVRTMQRGGDGGGASAASAAEARTALAELEAAAAQSGGGVPLPPDDKARGGGVAVGSVVKGDRVVVPRLGPTEVEVVDAPAGKKELIVLWGGMRAKVKYNELTSRRAAPPPAVQPTGGRRSGRGDGGGSGRSGPPLVRTSANTVDLRGQRVEAALGNLDDTLARTLVLGGVWLIHGHGSGKLKRALREALNQNELVAAWRDGATEEGGSGVTVVTFK